MTQARTLSAVYVSLGPISAGPCEEAFDFLQNGATWLYIRAFVATQEAFDFRGKHKPSHRESYSISGQGT